MIRGRDSALYTYQHVVLKVQIQPAQAQNGAGKRIPGSGATRFGFSFSGASRSTCVGSSNDGAIMCILCGCVRVHEAHGELYMLLTLDNQRRYGGAAFATRLSDFRTRVQLSRRLPAAPQLKMDTNRETAIAKGL